MRRLIKILTSRLLLIVPLVCLQFALFVAFFYQVSIVQNLQPYFSLASILASIYVINRDAEPAYKIAWIMVILGAPIIGIPLYILAGNRHVPKKLYNGTVHASENMSKLLDEKQDFHQMTKQLDPDLTNVFRYAYEVSGFPVHQGTECTYYDSGEEWFPHYLEALKSAKHFIFMEYFIIDEGSMWDEVLAILKQKALEGVTVKLIYDDFGSVTLPYHYDLELRKYGIEAYPFNRLRPTFIVQMNNRDHRKITVIDNNIGFTGGVNLSDEYVQREKRFGYWKDSAIQIHGEAVWPMTMMFLGMYSYVSGRGDTVDYSKYRLPCDKVSDGGFYQPYSDTPTDDEPVALNMHINMINHAKEYIYIDTPYLILTESMVQALLRAAKCGVDVRILTPAIPDKQLVFQITRGFYERLTKNGIKIYEYTPGFNHAKNFVCDDQLAIIGSANTDYRSYFLHFENGVLFHRSPEVLKVKESFLKSIEKSHLMTLEELDKEWFLVKIFRAMLNVFIPLV